MIPDSVLKWRALAGMAKSFGMEQGIVLAVIWQESGGNPWAYNPEPRYRWYWNVKANKPFRTLTPEEIASESPPADFPCLVGDPDQEWWGQEASWGLMQVMGAVARERGFRGSYLTQLCEPEIGVQIGCLHLQHHLLATNDRRAALLRYNGGGNPKYPDEVLAKMKEIENVR